MYEVFKSLCDARGITTYRFCKDTGVSTSTISTWKTKDSVCSTKLAKIVSEYFGVSINYILTGKEENAEEIEKSRIVNMNLQMDEILNADTLMFDGKPIDPESAELLQKQIEIALETIRLKRKK